MQFKRKTPKFRPREVAKPIRSKKPDKFSDIRKQRRVSTYSQRLEGLKPLLKIFRRIFLVLVPILLLVVLGLFLFRNDTFLINQIEVVGNKRLKTEDIEAFLSKYSEVNLFSLNKGILMNDLKTRFFEIDDINLVKKYPNEIILEIVETQPSVIALNLNTVNLISNEGVAAGNITVEEFTLTEDENKLLNNEILADSDFIRNRLQAKAEEGVFRWDEITSEEKEEELNLAKSEVNARLEGRFRQLFDLVKNSSFKDLPVLYKESNETISLNRESINFVLALIEALQTKDLLVAKVNLLNVYDFVFELEDNKSVIFTLRRSLIDQSRDFNTIIFNNYLLRGSVFDLRSTNFSIE